MGWNSTYANRGMFLEQIIEISNKQYEAIGKATISKRPTPIKPVRQQANKVIGFFEKKSTVDYEGILHNGKHIEFDAKETKVKNLPFGNIEAHQINHLLKVKKMKGYAFFIVCFTELDRFFRIDIDEFIRYTNNPWKSNKKSIPLKYFEEKAVEVKRSGKVLLDYLEGVA